MERPANSLAAAACAIVCTSDPGAKVNLSKETATEWFKGTLPLTSNSVATMPQRPGRPARPLLAAPRKVPKRGFQTIAGRVALLHALAHIELNAIDLAWDIVGRFAGEPLPSAFFDDWVRVGAEEAMHFSLLTSRLHEMGATYGDLPAHDGLWQAAEATAGDLLARLAIVPLVLEARGLDVTPLMMDNLTKAGDHTSAAILDIIYQDEKGHVGTGVRWFNYVCHQCNETPVTAFQALVKRYFRGAIKPPFNTGARTAAGLTPDYYKPLSETPAPVLAHAPTVPKKI